MGRNKFVENSEKRILFLNFMVLLLENLRIDNFYSTKTRCNGESFKRYSCNYAIEFLQNEKCS